MKAVVQRVRDASVRVDGELKGSIAWGLLVYLGVAAADSEKDADWMAEKTANLRIFNDEQGKMNLSLLDIKQSISDGVNNSSIIYTAPGVLAISQFTLLADARKGRRPYYGEAAESEKANSLYLYFMEKIRGQGLDCQAGVFKAMMDVSYTNQGPVTILLDSKDA